MPCTCCGLQADWFGGLFKHCEPPECCCGCCSALRPRYKRLVDNIFPANPQDGLIKNNMEKLTFYALSSPEKLDRIGEYVAQKLARDMSRHRTGYVIMGMDAMDQLLIACHAQTLNLFVESYLKIVQQLLESQEPQMQLLATQSFMKFANIEEDTASYHRRYDFFVSKFSSLCHDNNTNLETRKTLRVAGLNGLKGVIRKTVSDDLQVDIWDETHMDKIIPSLLYNMQDQEVIPSGLSATDSAVLGGTTPSTVAEESLRELMGRATFGNIRAVIRPVLKHLDNHNLWNSRHPDDFAADCFRIIMYSIQSQHSYAVIQILMSHLDERQYGDRDSSTQVRTGIVTVLSNIVAISASESIGPSVLEIINSLLNHLRYSINNQAKSENLEHEIKFQETVINTLGEFANNLPDFQKIEIMMFIMSKVPATSATSQTDILLQDILLKSLLKVSTKYKTVNMAQAFTTSFLKPLLTISLALDPNVRLTVQHIFHQLLDRHNNLPKLVRPVSLTSLPVLTMEKAYRQDLMFMRKHGAELMGQVYENLQVNNNTVDNFNALYTTLALLCVEMSSEEALTELLRLTLAMQDLATSGSLTESHRAAIHSLVAGFLHLASSLTAIPALCSHIEQVIKTREEKAPHMLPEFNSTERRSSQPALTKKLTPEEVAEELLFNKATITEALRSTGHDTSRLLVPYLTGSVVDSGMTRSVSDLNAINVDVDSVNSSPGLQRKHPDEEISFQSLKKILSEPPTVEQEAKEERRLQTVERFRTTPFIDLVAKSERKSSDLQHKLAEIFSKMPSLTATSPVLMKKSPSAETGLKSPAASPVSSHPSNPFTGLCKYTYNARGPPLFAVQFPDLFVY